MFAMSDSDRESVVIRFEGDAGDGVISMGLLAARTASRTGFHVYTYSTFLAVVRGGQSTFQLRLGREPLLSQGDQPDILVALNHRALRDNAPQVTAGGLVLHPPFEEPVFPHLPESVQDIVVDVEGLSQQHTGESRSKNVVAAAAVLEMLGLDVQTAADVVREMFAAKGSGVVDTNLRALEAGAAAGVQCAEAAMALRVVPSGNEARLLMSGNEAVALGALVGGVRFFAGYPITPASEIMEWLAKHLPRVGGRMVQAEDEIAALAMCIGASYGGVKSMTATSGPGLSLMSELVGLAGMMETPVVIVDVQRAGPSTGMPTKEGQGDLNLAVHGTHGEVPRVVLAPQTVAGCFEQTVRAINIAHEFHVPVILLSSQSLSHRMQTVDLPDPTKMVLYQEPLFDGKGSNGTPFQRFRSTPDGRPALRSIPGTPGGTYRASGLEHDELGNPDFEPETRTRMVERRRERMHAIERAFQDSVERDCLCANGAPLGVMSWGSTASAARDVVETLRKEGWQISYLFPRMLWPLPDRAIRRFLASGVRTLFVCELNATRQFAEMIRARYTPDLVRHGVRVMSITKDDGLPFTPAEIRSRLFDLLSQDIASQEGLPLSSQEIRDRIFGRQVVLQQPVHESVGDAQ